MSGSGWTTFLALTVNTAVLTLYAKLFGQAWESDWGAGLTAPFTEETAKALGFLVIMGLAPRLVRTAYDAFIIGAFIGLGFEVAEDVLYVYQGAGRSFGTDQILAVVQMVVVRGLSGIVSTPCTRRRCAPASPGSSAGRPTAPRGPGPHRHRHRHVRPLPLGRRRRRRHHPLRKPRHHPRLRRRHRARHRGRPQGGPAGDRPATSSRPATTSPPPSPRAAGPTPNRPATPGPR